MSGVISVLNKLTTNALRNMASEPNTLRLWIEDGRITGFQNGDGGKIWMESRTGTDNIQVIKGKKGD